MIIRSIDEVAGSERDVSGEGWRSRRLLRRDDGMKHSLHWTELAAGTELDLHLLRPGVMYALDKHDHHRVRALTDVKLVCVFWPALTGDEKHDPEGGYAASPED